MLVCIDRGFVFLANEKYAHLSADTVYVASALAANTIMRSFFAMAFPLFTTQMYSGLGDQWASSIRAFLTVGCLPFPFLFYKYGSQIRARCKYTAETGEMPGVMQDRAQTVADDGEQSEKKKELP